MRDGEETMKGMVASLLGTVILVVVFVIVLGRIPPTQKRLAIIVFVIVAALTTMAVAFYSKRGR